MCESICLHCAPFGHYGPWNGSKSPLAFTSPFGCALKYAKKNVQQTPKKNPCKWTFWPLSGSCRFSGRPWGPCRSAPFSSRGPFGSWLDKPKVLSVVQPETPLMRMNKRPYLNYGASVQAGYIDLRRPCAPQKPSCKYPCYPNYPTITCCQQYRP